LLGTRPVVIGVGSIIVLQAALTYIPWMQRLFETSGLSLTQSLVVVAVGVIVFAVLELEKHALLYLSAWRQARAIALSHGDQARDAPSACDAPRH
jgi:magnesium-transporting ATPase (P-type)